MVQYGMFTTHTNELESFLYCNSTMLRLDDTYLSSPITHGGGNVFWPVKDPNKSFKIFIFNVVWCRALLLKGGEVKARQEDTANMRKIVENATFIVTVYARKLC